MKRSIARAWLKSARYLVLFLAVSVHAANPLDATWTQVGFMSPDGNMFNGDCNLDLSGCTFTDGADFWQPFAGAHQILFITSDGMYWGQADYSDVANLVEANTGTFEPNLQWINAGSITGNLLMRSGVGEDLWVTLEGSHCVHQDPRPPCGEILWGQNAYPSADHASLSSSHGGVMVYARSLTGSLIARLRTTLDSFNLPSGLLRSFQAKLEGPTCGPLGAFTNEVQAQSDKALTYSQAQELLSIANQLRTALACKK